MIKGTFSRTLSTVARATQIIDPMRSFFNIAFPASKKAFKLKPLSVKMPRDPLNPGWKVDFKRHTGRSAIKPNIRIPHDSHLTSSLYKKVSSLSNTIATKSSLLTSQRAAISAYRPVGVGGIAYKGRKYIKSGINSYKGRA